MTASLIVGAIECGIAWVVGATVRWLVGWLVAKLALTLRTGWASRSGQGMLVRRPGTVIILEAGVFFPMRDIDRSKRRDHPICFITRAGFARLTGEHNLSQADLQQLFRRYRRVIEGLANVLYETPSAS